MTHNQIDYAKAVEAQRNNRVVEQETYRANYAREQETYRHNLVTEGEAVRHNKAQEALGYAQVAAQNYATAQNAANVASQVAAQREATYINQRNVLSQLAETTRHNQQLELIDTTRALNDYNIKQQQLAETTRHNTETERLDLLRTRGQTGVGMLNATGSLIGSILGVGARLIS